MEKSQYLLKDQLILFFVGVILIIASLFVDEPIATWASLHQFRANHFFENLVDIPNVLGAIVFFIYPLVILRFSLGKYTYHDRAALLFANSVVITLFFKDTLKFLFARDSASTWVENKAAFLSMKTLGFKWFDLSSEYQSFPSGHAAVAVAAMIALAIAYPRMRWFSLIIMLVVMIALVILYYHFLSDVIAGALLGYIIAVCNAEIVGIKR